jgi:hypothetical protein
MKIEQHNPFSGKLCRAAENLKKKLKKKWEFYE